MSKKKGNNGVGSEEQRAVPKPPSKPSIAQSVFSFIASVRSNRSKLLAFILPFVIVLLLLGLVYVGLGNHALYYNTKLYESLSSLYQTPDWYSLSEMRVEIDKTYYPIQRVAYVFSSVGTKYSIADGTLTQGYLLGHYQSILGVVLVSTLYFIFEVLQARSSGLSIRQKIKTGNRWWAIGFVIALIMHVFLVAQVLFPLF